MTHRVTQLEAAAVSEIGPRVRVTQLFVRPLAADKTLPIRDTQLFSQLVLADKTLPVRVTQFFVHTIQSIDQTIRPGVTGLQPAIPVEDNGFIGVDSVAGFAEPFQPPIFDRESNPFRPDLAQPVSPRLPGMIDDLQPQRESLSMSGPASAIGVASIPTFESPVPQFENPMTPPAPAGGSPDRVGVIVDMMRESQEAQRQVHEKNQAGDTTTPWEFLTRVSNEQLFTPGSIGRFYHDDYGMIQARYVKFAQMDSSLQWINAPVGRLAASPEFGWEVTNRFDKSSAFLAEGIIASYVMPKNGQYGWVTISGANHTRVFLRDTPRPTQGQNVSWWGPEAVTGTRAGKVLGYIVGNKGLTRLEPGMLYICVGGVSRTEIESWFTESFEQIQTIFDEIAERLEAIEGSDNPSTLAQLTADVEKLRADLTMESQARASAIRGLANQISALDFVSSADLTSFESGLRAYIYQQDAVLAGQAGNALARANAAYALAESIPDYRSEITRLDAGIAAALSNIATLLLNYLPQGLLADRPVTPTAAPNVSVFWFSTDTNTLSVYDFVDSVWVDITGGGVGPIALDDLTDVDTATTPPVAGDVLTYDGTEWIPTAPASGTSFLGALAGKTADQALATVTTTVISFDTESYDIGNWHSNTVNNGRMTVPAGVSRVRLTGRLSRTNQTSQLVAAFRKNGSSAVIGLPAGDTDTAGGDSVTVSSAVLWVVPGDYFEMTGFVDGASSITTESWFSIEAVAVPAVVSSGSEWELLDVSGNPLSSGSTWNFFFNPVTTLNIINLAPYKDVRIVIRDVSTANVAFRFVRVSHDNGATFSTSGYRIPNSNTNFSTFDFNNAAANVQRYGAIVINNIKGVKYWPRIVEGDARNAGFALYDGLTTDINAVQVSSSNGNMTSGTLHVYGRV